MTTGQIVLVLLVFQGVFFLALLRVVMQWTYRKREQLHRHLEAQIMGLKDELNEKAAELQGKIDDLRATFPPAPEPEPPVEG